MKILFVLPSLAIGGLEKVQVSVANALSRRGHEVTILVLDGSLDMAKHLEPSIRLMQKPYGPKHMKKIPYIRHKFYDDGMWETRATPQRLHKYYVGKEHFDVEVGFFRGRPVKLVSGCQNPNTVKLAWVHNDFEKISGYMSNFKSLAHVRRAYGEFNTVVCVSKQAEHSFKKVIGDTGNLTTIYNLSPVSKIKIQAEEKPEKSVSRHRVNTVLVARLLDSAKGQLRLIKVISKLQEEGVDIGLTLVGDGPDRARIEKFIKEINAQDYIHLVGMAENPYPYIKNSDLLVCASIFEGYNLTVAEALICGTPVLSTDCTGPNEILDNGKYGMIVENSEEGLREGLKKLYENPELLKHYKIMTQERTEFFSEEKIISQIEELCEVTYDVK